MPRYQKIGTIEKRKGLQMYEYCFNYGLLSDDRIIDVFIVKCAKKAKTKHNQQIQRTQKAVPLI